MIPKTVTVMFVPQTKKGELAKRLQMVEDDIAKVTGSRVIWCHGQENAPQI